jgi:hypothetical protein
MRDVLVGPRVSAPLCVGPCVASLASRSTASATGSNGVTPPTPSARATVTIRHVPKFSGRLRLKQWRA